MYTLDKNKATIALQAQGYDLDQAARMLSHFPDLPDEFGVAIDQWMVDQKTPNFEVNGLSVEKVMEYRFSPFLSAMSDLFMLIDPKQPEAKHQMWQRILGKPIPIV